jgi:hypothetical protein
MSRMKLIIFIACTLNICSLVLYGFDREQQLTNNKETVPTFVDERDVLWNGYEVNGRKQNTFVYTRFDKESLGGITGQVEEDVELVLATPIGEPDKLYRAELDKTTGSFLFKGLPMGRYDLLIFDKNFCYEGITLSRENTLTDLDKNQIEKEILKSEPFYPNKTIWRIEGQSSRGNQAQVIASYYRPKATVIDPLAGNPIEDLWKRNVKVITLKNVKDQWQIIHSRSCNSEWIMKNTNEFSHRFIPSSFSKIRVVNEIKNIGKINLKSYQTLASTN